MLLFFLLDVAARNSRHEFLFYRLVMEYLKIIGIGELYLTTYEISFLEIIGLMFKKQKLWQLIIPKCVQCNGRIAYLSNGDTLERFPRQSQCFNVTKINPIYKPTLIKLKVQLLHDHILQDSEITQILHWKPDLTAKVSQKLQYNLQIHWNSANIPNPNIM